MYILMIPMWFIMTSCYRINDPTKTLLLVKLFSIRGMIIFELLIVMFLISVICYYDNRLPHIYVDVCPRCCILWISEPMQRYVNIKRNCTYSAIQLTEVIFFSCKNVLIAKLGAPSENPQIYCLYLKIFIINQII